MYPDCMAVVNNGDSLGPNDAVWWQRSWSTLAQVMACCLTAPSHYLKQCWFAVSKIHWHSFESVFYQKFFEHPSFRQVAHEIYLSKWKVHSSEILITIMYFLIHVFDGCSNRFEPCDHSDLVCCCLSPVLISHKRSCCKISQSLKPIWLDVEMLVPLFKKKNQSVLQRCLSNFRAIGRLKEA